MPGTVRLHRVIATNPEKLYRAFLEPDAVASWLPPYGFICTVHELEARVGGTLCCQCLGTLPSWDMGRSASRELCSRRRRAMQ